MNFGNTQQTYNNISYDVYCFIYNSDITLTAPDLITNDTGIVVPTNQILYIMIENSIDDCIPKAEFEIQDDGHAMTNRIKAQNTRVFLLIKKGRAEKDIVMKLTFIVKNYKILNTNQERTTYKLFCELDNAIPLNTLCEYATSCDLSNDSENLENPYEISRNILLQTGYKMYPISIKDEKGKNQQTRYSLPYTNEYCHFISYQNMKAIDAVKYLFSYAVGKNGLNPPAYLIHNIIDDKGYITTLENCFNPKSVEAQPTLLQIPFSITKPITPSRMYTMFETDVNSTDGGIENAQQFFNYKFSEYDQERREWEDYSINKLALNDLLTKGININEKSIYMDLLKEDITMSKYYKYSPHSHPLMYDILKNLELYSSNVQFSIEGDLQFDVGQVVNIYETGEGDSKIEQFNGRWVICKLRHSFRNKEYRINMICSRRFRQNYIMTSDRT